MIERTFIQQNLKKIQIEEFVKAEMDRAGFTKLEIVKTPMVTRFIVNVTHPGLAIGKGGQNIRKLTKEIEEKFGVENAQIEIKEIKIPELDAKAVVGKMKNLLERGYSWRSVAFRTVRDISKAGAQGVEIILKGALGGKGQRKRKQRIAEGYLKKTGEQVKLVDYAKASSYPKYGAIGIKVRIVKPDTVFPDKINFNELLDKREKEKEEKIGGNEEKEEVKEEKKVEAVEKQTEEKEKTKTQEKEKKIIEEGKGTEKKIEKKKLKAKKSGKKIEKREMNEEKKEGKEEKK